MTATETKTAKKYHTSGPEIPKGLVEMTKWADERGLSRVCVQRWIYAGRLKSFRIPGYGTRNFIHAEEAERCTRPIEQPMRLAR